MNGLQNVVEEEIYRAGVQAQFKSMKERIYALENLVDDILKWENAPQNESNPEPQKKERYLCPYCKMKVFVAMGQENSCFWTCENDDCLAQGPLKDSRIEAVQGLDCVVVAE